MTLPLLVFAGVLALVIAPYFVFVVRPEGEDQRRLRKRLKDTDRKRQDRVALVKEADHLSSVGILDTVLSRGQVIVEGGAFHGRAGHGRFVRRGLSDFLR